MVHSDESASTDSALGVKSNGSAWMLAALGAAAAGSALTIWQGRRHSAETVPSPAAVTP